MRIKGYFTSLAEMAQNVHPVNIVMGRDGLYEIRSTPIGVFSRKVNYLLEELDAIKEGFILTLPHKIPSELLAQSIAFFRKWGERQLEVQVQIFWDNRKSKYFIYVPKQHVTETTINTKRNLALERTHTLVLELHSHHQMSAIFSKLDNDWEKTTGLYGVIGNINKENFQANFRYSCGGEFHCINLKEIFQEYSQKLFKEINVYPKEWDKQITTSNNNKTVKL
jgi:PRTRC genetic system protein A